MRNFAIGRVILAFLVSGTALSLGTGLAGATQEPWAERTPAIGAVGDLPQGRLDTESLKRLIAIGEDLFTAKFTTLDGAGRPAATQAIIPTRRRHAPQNAFFRTAGMDANGCSGCHNDPIVGGAGDFVTNVFVSEGFESADFDSLDPQFSNERGSTHLFGAGLIELLAREMTHDLHAIRDRALEKAWTTGVSQRVELVSKDVSFGFLSIEPDGSVGLDELEGIDTDLVVRPFSQKGVMTSLRMFTVNAMNHHHGLQPVERWGARWTGTDDHDEDGHRREFMPGDISALVAWQATLPAPARRVPDDTTWAEAAAKGEKAFDEFGCATCHRPHLPLESLAFADPGPFDVAGTLNDRQVHKPAIYDLALLDWAKDLPRDDRGRILVPLYGDLKRYVMTDNQVDALGNELLAQRFVDRNIFITAELWGVGSTPPYGHRNDFTTLDEIIRAHGGDGRPARDAYVAASDEARSSIIAFLKTLVIEANTP